jgi:hypothetical protein
MLQKLGYPAAIALAFITIGFLFLGVGWNGAAGQDCVPCQIPYLLSGGGVGLGLIIIGTGLLLFEAGRRVITRLEERIDRLNETLLLGALSSNGRAPTEASTDAGAPSPTAVVIGVSSFHLQDCRLVEGKDDLTYGSADEAGARCLTPCRVCDPSGALSKTKRASSKR